MLKTSITCIEHNSNHGLNVQQKGHTPSCAIKNRWALWLKVEVLGVHIATNHPSPTKKEQLNVELMLSSPT